MARDIFDSMGVDGFITYYIFMMAFVMGVLLLGLSGWHGRMISRGETSVERVLNQTYAHHEDDLVFPHMHKTSLIANWKRFFGIRDINQFLRRILLPSTHKPRGNGIDMDGDETKTHLYLHKPAFDPLKQPASYTSDNYHRVSDGLLVSKYRSAFPSWQRQSISNSFSSCYKPRRSLADWENNNTMNKL